MQELRGISWNHTRGFVPVVATAQRFEELFPHCRIHWEKRSLQAFADASLTALAKQYDLIIMDHPHVALAVRENALRPLDALLSPDFLREQASHTVGASHASYQYESQQWALAVDTAAPIATCRPDLLRAYRLKLPQTWEDVMTLARAGYVTVSLYSLDALMHVYMFCQAQGSPAFATESAFAETRALARSLMLLKEIAECCAPACLERDPIQTAEFMSTVEEKSAAYCPFAYGYANYARFGYAKYMLQAGDLVSWEGKPLASVLGGAGLAISAYSAFPQMCASYVQFTAEAVTQKGIYFQAGGQPGHRAAWLDNTVNLATQNYFLDTLSTLDRALVRPQYAGYMFFQDHATLVMQDYLKDGLSLEATMERLQALYQESRET